MLRDCGARTGGWFINMGHCSSIISSSARWVVKLSLGAFALSAIALSSAAEPAADDSTTSTMAADTANPVAAATSVTPAKLATATENKVSPPLSQQSFKVIEAVGVGIKLSSPFDVHKPITLKKGQMLVLKSSLGQMIEVDGPYRGKAIDHYTAISDNATMGYDARSSDAHSCSGSGTSRHPTGGPNPDETGGTENQVKHCP